MSGRVGDLSTQQEHILCRFKEKVADILKPEHDDHYLLRWLRAREFDLEKSEAMLRKHITWRKQYGIDNQYEYTEMFKYFPSGIIGYDKTGCPVRVVMYGEADFEGAAYSNTKSSLTKNFAKLFETDLKLMKEQTTKLGRHIETHLCIVDMDKFYIRYAAGKTVLNLCGFIFTLYEDNYPECLRKCYIVNAPSYFPAIFALVKPFLSEETVRKIEVHSKEGWKERLLEEVEADILPAFLGGTRVDPDGNPRCPLVVPLGELIPRSMYLKNKNCKLPDSDDLKKATVNRGNIYSIEVQVEEKDAVIQWEFQTGNGDIAFGLFYKGDGDSLEEIIPKVRLESNLAPEEGIHQCQKTGTYVLQFDNTFSWFRKKKLRYQVRVINPEKTADDLKNTE